MNNQIDNLTPAEWRTIAHKLWDMLDDIDTLSDAMKPERTAYFDAVMRHAERRHQLLVSDGYDLAPADGLELQPSESAALGDLMQRNATPATAPQATHVGIDLMRNEMGLPPA